MRFRWFLIGGDTGGGDYATNVAQSSTGNIYGIYDLNGGVWERVAVWNALSTSDSIATYGNSFASSGGNSTKYATTYEEYVSNGYENGKTGDGIKEVFTGTYRFAWFSDYTTICSSANPFLQRGGPGSDNALAGIFYSCSNAGGPDTMGWRIIMT